MAVNANFATTPRYAVASTSTAKTDYGASNSNVTLLFTAGPNGSRVDQIGWSAQGSTTEGVLAIYVREDSAADWKLAAAVIVPERTVSATAPPWGGGATNLNIVLAPGAQIGFAPTKAEPFMMHITLAGDF